MLLVAQEAWHFHLSALIKFGIIGGIIGFAFAYERNETINKSVKPAFDLIKPVFAGIARVAKFPFGIFALRK